MAAPMGPIRRLKKGASMRRQFLVISAFVALVVVPSHAFAQNPPPPVIIQQAPPPPVYVQQPVYAQQQPVYAQQQPVLMQPVAQPMIQPIAAPPAAAGPAWNLFASLGGGYGLGYFSADSGYSGFLELFHGGLIDFNIGVAYSDAPGTYNRGALGVGYDFQAIVDSTGMLHHHYVGMTMLGFLCYKAELGIMALSPFDAGDTILGFSAKLAVGLGFMVGPNLHLSFELPMLIDIPFDQPESATITGFTTGVQAVVSYF